MNALIEDIARFGGSGGGPPSGAAGGDLTGTYPNPSLAATIAGDHTWTGFNNFAGDFQTAGGIASFSGNTVILIADYITIAANLSLFIGGIPQFTGINFGVNESGAIAPAISAGQVLYSDLGTYYNLDAAGVNKPAYLNYDLLGVGYQIIKNIGVAGNITIDADPLGASGWVMTPVVLTPGQSAQFAGNATFGDYTIYKVG